MLHIESLIDTQRRVCIKMFLGDSIGSWTSVYLIIIFTKSVVDCFFIAVFEYLKLPLKPPDYYRECLTTLIYYFIVILRFLLKSVPNKLLFCRPLVAS